MKLLELTAYNPPFGAHPISGPRMKVRSQGEATMMIKQIKDIAFASILAMLAAICFASCSAPNDRNGIDGTGVRDTINSNDGNMDMGLGDNDGNRMTDKDGTLLGDVVDGVGNTVRRAGNAVGDTLDGVGDTMNGNDAATQNDGINAKPGGGNTTANR